MYELDKISKFTKLEKLFSHSNFYPKKELVIVYMKKESYENFLKFGILSEHPLTLFVNMMVLHMVLIKEKENQ